MRLIDADAIPEVSWDQKEEAAFRATINKMPTIDAEPVRRGRWIAKAYPWDACSLCGTYVDGYYCWRYCPYCGAKMEDKK